MKLMNSTTTTLAVLLTTLVTSLAVARGGGIPPELKAKLTEDQQTQLTNASSMEERIALLKSWGIAPPERPHQGARPSEEVHELFEAVRLAVTDSEIEAAREALRQYYKTSSVETDRAAIRQFFARHPTSVSNGDASVSSSASSVSR